MTDSEKTALAVGGAVAALAVLYFLAARNAPQVTTDASGNIVPTAAASAPSVTPVSSPATSGVGTAQLTPNPTGGININTGASNCGCGCTQGSNAVTGTVNNLTAQYSAYLAQTEQSYLNSLLGTWESNAYPGSLDIGENGNNFELIYGGTGSTAQYAQYVPGSPPTSIPASANTNGQQGPVGL